MVSLLELRPQFESVNVGADQKVEIYGLSAEAIATLFARFPALQRMLAGQGLSFADVRVIAPDAIAAIIALASNTPPEDLDAAEEIAKILPIEAQFDLLAAIGRLTFPGGFDPFVKRIEALSEKVSRTIPSQKQSTG